MKAIAFCFLLFLSSALFAARTSMPNEEMNKILKEMDKKGAKPIESLTVDEARKQPCTKRAGKYACSFCRFYGRARAPLRHLWRAWI